MLASWVKPSIGTVLMCHWKNRQINPWYYVRHSLEARSIYFHSHVSYRLIPSNFSWYAAYLMKAYPLDMSQYVRLFNTSRIPQKERDELRTHKEDNHILVLRNGHFFVFDIVRDGKFVVCFSIMSTTGGIQRTCPLHVSLFLSDFYISSIESNLAK